MNIQKINFSNYTPLNNQPNFKGKVQNQVVTDVLKSPKNVITGLASIGIVGTAISSVVSKKGNSDFIDKLRPMKEETILGTIDPRFSEDELKELSNCKHTDFMLDAIKMTRKQKVGAFHPKFINVPVFNSNQILVLNEIANKDLKIAQETVRRTNELQFEVDEDYINVVSILPKDIAYELLQTKNSDGSDKYNYYEVYILAKSYSLGIYDEKKAGLDKVKEYAKQNKLDDYEYFRITTASDRIDGFYFDVIDLKTKESIDYRFNSEGDFLRADMNQSTRDYDNNHIISKTPKYNIDYRRKGTNQDFHYSKKIVEDNNGNLLFTEEFVKSRINPNKFDVYRTYPNGKKYKVGYVGYSTSGDYIVQKNITTEEGIINKYFYTEDKSGNTYTKSKIIDKDGKVLLNHDYKFKVLGENHFQSIENGTTYDIVYSEKEVKVTKGDGKTISISIGENDESETGVLSRDLLPVIKKIPGSVLFKISEYNLKKMGKDINGVSKDNAHFDYTKNLVALSKELSGNYFCLLHELGHYIDGHKKIYNNKELLKIFNEEQKELMENQSTAEIDYISYLAVCNNNSGGVITEMIAETNAMLYANNNWRKIEERGQYLQHYFPKTYAKIAELLTENSY